MLKTGSSRAAINSGVRAFRNTALSLFVAISLIFYGAYLFNDGLFGRQAAAHAATGVVFVYSFVWTSTCAALVFSSTFRLWALKPESDFNELRPVVLFSAGIGILAFCACGLRLIGVLS